MRMTLIANARAVVSHWRTGARRYVRAGAMLMVPLLLLALFALAIPAGRADDADDGAAMFRRIATVLQHPRCLNCHTTTNFPRQGDDRHPHYWGVMRGADNRGVETERCVFCHASNNNNTNGIPGRPDWHLAPLTMGWEGLTPAELCHVLLDPVRNGNRSPRDVATHISTDRQFVAWAWTPGRNPAGVERQTPPIPHDEFARLVEHWVALGAACPK